MEPTRKIYRKPQIRQVKLVVEEAVLQACKTNASEAARTRRTCDHPDASVLDPRKRLSCWLRVFAEQRNMDIAGIKLSFLPNSLPDLRLREKLTKPGSGEEA